MFRLTGLKLLGRVGTPNFFFIFFSTEIPFRGGSRVSGKGVHIYILTKEVKEIVFNGL